jgi:hypothetical protein
MHRSRTIVAASLAFSMLALAACDDGAPAAGTTPAPAAGGAPAWVLAAAPADAVGVKAAKAEAKEGDAIVLRGIIGGEMKPVSPESPVVRIVDAGLFNRCTAEDDHCATPWDYCCADPADVIANSATVQIVDERGNAITGDPTAGGLAPLDEIVVVGTVGPRATNEVLIVKATGVFLAGG